MKKYLLILLFLAAAAPVFAQTHPAPISCIPLRSVAKEDVPYRAGESLIYVVHYKWGVINADVAQGYVTVDSARVAGRDAFRCRAFGRNAKAFDPFFKVREDFCAWLSMDGLVPLRYTRDTREGDYYAVDEYRYIYGNGEKYIAAELDSKSKGKRSMNLPMDDCTMDFISLLFIARNMDVDRLVEGRPYPVSYALKEKVSTVQFVYGGRETRKVKNLGMVRLLKFTIQKAAIGEDAAGADLTFWLSDDGNRIPVLFDTPVRVGTVTGYIKEWDGLKYPVNFLVK